MLVIDSDKLKLVKMQERLLMATENNREENLSNYIRTVKEIDSVATSFLLTELEHISEHNQSLEEELKFLQDIKESYDQLLELQLGFKQVCETNGGYNLVLSDLSQLNIGYIEDRINVINGYLLNLRNIEINKNRIQELNENLAEEEKKKDHVCLKLEQFESYLRESFLDAEGRTISSGNLQYTSVIDEYKNLGIDFRVALDDSKMLAQMLVDIEKERLEVSEKFSAAEICYNNFPNSDSKQILDEINIDFLRTKYRLTMIKILELLSYTYKDYDKFKEKREDILGLIRYRVSYLESLGVRLSIDPFSRTKTREQLEKLKDIVDNAKVINQIKKELSQLTSRTENMINQNDSYLISLANTKELLVNKMSLNDALVYSSDLQLDIEEELLVAQDNQVVNVRDIFNKLNMDIVRQKTDSVIKRVNQMINEKPLEVVSTQKEEFISSPELVIVPSSSEKEKPVFEEIKTDDIFEIAEEETLFSDESILDFGDDIFSTVEPFSEPIIFSDKSDDSLQVNTASSLEEDVLEFDELANNDEDVFPQVQDDEPEEMPDAFWVIEADGKVEEDNTDDSLSFDDQINLLINN